MSIEELKEVKKNEVFKDDALCFKDSVEEPVNLENRIFGINNILVNVEDNEENYDVHVDITDLRAV